MVIMDKVSGYSFSTLCGLQIVIWIVSVGVSWVEIWGNFGLVRLGVDGYLVSAVGIIIFGGGGVMVDL